MKDEGPTSGIVAHPLLPAAGLFLLGVAGGSVAAPAGWSLVGLAAVAWIIWSVCEWRHWCGSAHAALATAILLCGSATWSLNQQRVTSTHLARWVPTAPQTQSMATLRATVLAASPNESPASGFGEAAWIVEATEIQTAGGWQRASGNLLVRTPTGAAPAPGALVELYGWLARPQGATNPGGFDERARLAADRIFVQMRIPRTSGVVVRTSAAPGAMPWVARLRTYLRSKLLAHVIDEDVPAAQALTALLLGQRDPGMADVSQNFADAGVAHLLAISGTHIVFFTALVWGILRFVPLRPRWRELLIAAIVGLYILATPCGPPILRAGIGLMMVLLARFLGRPRQYLNMLAAAAIVIILLRPTDLANAGFQLTFACTAGLILFSQRVHGALFGRWLERQALFAALARTRRARWRQRLARLLAGALTANLIGAATALPLVAYHFGQVNLWAAAAGIIALPFVCLAMLAAALQLLLELAGIGALMSVPAAFAGRIVIQVVALLAHVPGAAVPVRTPPAWLVLLAYLVLALWALRRRLNLTRAPIVNAVLLCAVVTTGWYVLTFPARTAQLIAFDAGNSCSLLLRLPDGSLWSLDAGADKGVSMTAQVLVPAMRQQGARHLDGQIVTALDATHAGQADEVLARCLPRQLLVSQPAWDARDQTLAGWQLAATATNARTPVIPLQAGQRWCIGGGILQVLSPSPQVGATASHREPRRDLILLWEIQGRRILLADPASAMPLALLPPITCDAVVFLGPQHGASDAAVRRLFASSGAPPIIWCGRGPWAPRSSAPGEWNTRDGAVALDISGASLSIRRSAP